MEGTSGRLEQIQEEVQDIAEVLMREQPGSTVSQVWDQALTLHRVRYETEVLPPPKLDKKGR